MMQRPIVGTTPLEELRDSGKEFFTPGDVSRVLGCDPQSIRLQARQCPERLGFPVSVIGNRVKIPAKPFLAFMGG